MHYIANIIYDRCLGDEGRGGGLRQLRSSRPPTGKCHRRIRLHMGACTPQVDETLKDALDPNGILTPGRAGQMPKRFMGRGF